MGLQALAQAAGTAPSTTSPPTGLEKFASDADKLAGLLTSLLVTALVLLGVLALFVLAYQMVWLRIRRQLVLQDVVNASGMSDLDSRVPGLSQLLREQFVDQMGRLADKVRESVDAAANLEFYSSVIDNTPLPRNTPDQRLTDLAASVTSFAGDKAGPALQLLNTVLLRPKGTRVGTTLQRQGDKPGRLGVTFEIADLKGTDVPTPVTIWEAPSRPAPGGAETEPAPEEPEQRAARLGRAMRVLGRLLHLEARRPQPAGQPDKMLRPERPVEVGYLELLEPVVRRLVLELAKRELVKLPLRTLVRRIPAGQRQLRGLPAAVEAQRRRDQALVHNYVGSLYQTSAGSWKVRFLPEFRDLAEIEYTEALRLDEELYQAHENLAYLFGWPADEATDDEEMAARREQALLHFDQALALLESSRRVPEGEERLAATRLLTIGHAIMELHLAAGDDAVKQAKRSVEEVFVGWEPASERHRRVLYNLACWYGVVLQLGHADEGDGGRARRLLAYAMARTPTVAPSKASVERFWRLAGGDPELKPFADNKALAELRLAIERAQIGHRQLHRLEGVEFEQAINQVMDEVTWAEEGRTDR